MHISAAQLGDLITLRDDAGNVVATVEIDRTRKRSVALVVQSERCSIEHLPMADRADEPEPKLPTGCALAEAMLAGLRGESEVRA